MNSPPLSESRPSSGTGRSVRAWAIAVLTACSGGTGDDHVQANNSGQPVLFREDIQANTPMENAADDNGVEHHRPPREHE